MHSYVTVNITVDIFLLSHLLTLHPCFLFSSLCNTVPVLFFTRKSSVSSFSEPSLWCEEGLPLTEAVLLLLELSKPSSFMLTGWAHYCTLPIYCISIVRFYAGSISSKTESCVAGQKFVVITTSIQSCSFVAVLNLFLFLAKFLYLCSILLSCLICNVLCQKC